MIRIAILLFLPVIYAQAQTIMTAEEAIEIGLKNNFSIQIARNQQEISDNSAGKAISGFLPTLDISGNLQSAQTEQETNSPFSFGNSTTETKAGQINLNWNLFDGFSMFVNYDQYNQLAKLGEFQAKNTIENTVVSILSAYFNLVQQEQLLDVAGNALDISQTRLNKEKVRQEIGGASSTDYLNAQVSFNNDNTTFLNQQLRRVIAEKDLNILLGRDVNTPIDVAKTIVIPDLDYSDDEVLKLASERNSRLMIARQNKEIADNNVSLRAATLYPRLALNATYGYSERDVDSDSPRFTEPITTKSTDGAISLNLTYNLFNGMRDHIDWQNAKLERRNQELTLIDEQNRLAGLVREKLATFNQRLQLVELEEQNVIAAEKNLQLNRDRYDIGSATSLEFRDAQVNLIRSQTTLIVARYQARITRLELEQLMGTWQIPD